jgi:hypothetical protein
MICAAAGIIAAERGLDHLADVLDNAHKGAAIVLGERQATRAAWH